MNQVAASQLLKAARLTVIDLEDFIAEDGEFRWTAEAGRTIVNRLRAVIAQAEGTAPPLLDQQRVSRASGDSIVVGRCGHCGRRLGLNMANKTGVRCRYDGTQYDASGWAIRGGR